MGKQMHPYVSLSTNSIVIQPTIPIKTDNSAAKVIVTATFRQKRSKATDMRFYWMKDRVNKNDLFLYWKQGGKKMGH